MADPWTQYATGEEPTPQPTDYLGRARIYKELEDPAVRDRLIAYTQAEVGGEGPQAQQAFMETTFNRSVARGQPVAQTLSGSYFPDITHQRAARGINEGMRTAYSPIIDRALSENSVNYATGNASGTVGFAGGPQTVQFGGERFGVEGPDVGWHTRLGSQPQSDAWSQYAAEAPQPRPEPQTAQPQQVAQADPWTQYATEARPTPSEAPAEAPAAEPSKPGAVMRGIATGALQQQPELLGYGLEGLSQIAPEGVAPGLRSASDYMKQKSKELLPEEYKLTAPTFAQLYENPNWGDALTWAGETFGSTLASTALPLAGSLAGGAGGFAVGGPVGALVGGLGGGAAAASLPNYGELYKALIDEKVDPKQAATYAMYALPAMSALDVAGEALPAAQVLGLRAVRQEAVRGLARRIAAESVKAGLVEGGTEALQEAAVKQPLVSGVTGKPYLTKENVLATAENFLGGAMVGHATGAVAGLKPDVGPQPTREEAAANLAAALTAAGGPPLATPTGEKIPRPMTPEAALATVPAQEPAAPGATQPIPTMRPPEGVETVAEETLPEAPGKPVWYSALMRATAKVPESGSPQQILATLRNQPGVKQAEIDDTGLETWLRSQPGKVTKADLVSYLEENGIQVEEVHSSTNFPSAPNAATAHGYTVAPGPVQSYHELRLVLPPRGPSELFVTPHWEEPNVVGHVQFTTRIDGAGQPVLHIEGIQSDWHQRGRKEGYKGPYKEPDTSKWSAIQTQFGPGQFQNVWQVLDDQGNAYRAAGVRTTQEAIRRAAEIEHPKRARERGVPEAPFKTNWVELLTKRMYRWAADNGYSKISWANPALAIAWNTGAEGDIAKVPSAVQAGLTEFYGKIVPSRMKALAKQYGGVLGVTPMDVTTPVEIRRSSVTGFYRVLNQQGMVERVFNNLAAAEEYVSYRSSRPELMDVYHVTVPETATSVVQQGMALYDRDISEPGTAATDVRVSPHVGRITGGNQFAAEIKKVAGFVDDYAKKFGLQGKITVNVTGGAIQHGGRSYGQNTFGLAVKKADGSYAIYANAAIFDGNISALYSTMMHEFGHVVVWEHFDALPADTKLKMIEAFNDWRSAAFADGSFLNAMRRRRAAPRQWLAEQQRHYASNLGISGLSRKDFNYHFGDEEGFHEYMADQVARWATTSVEPLTTVEKAFAGIGAKLKQFIEWMSVKLGLDPNPNVHVKAWLDSFVTTAQPITAQTFTQVNMQTQATNQAAVAPNVPMPPRQPQTTPTRGTINQAFGGNPPAAVQAPAAFADRINFIYKYFAGILELAQANQNFTPLINYVDHTKSMHREITQILDAVQTIAKRWRRLGKRSENLTQFLDELTRMTYLSQRQRNAGMVRMPTPAEIQQMATRLNVDANTLNIANDVRHFFDTFLSLVTQNAIVDAQRLLANQPVLLAQRIAEIQGKAAQLRQRPYFPFMRFGRHFVLVKDPASGRTLHFETFEAMGPLKMRRAERKQQAAKQQLMAQYPGMNVTDGILPEEVGPFIGLPGVMLEHITQKLNLTPAQLDALRQLQFELSPSMSFQHHFQHKAYVPGYSFDFLRAFSRYGFFGARYYGHTKYVDGLRQDIRDARLVGGNKASLIADYMSDHLEKTLLDAKGDYGLFKGLAFFWALGYVPAAATQNMTQTPFVTFPMLSSKFGPPGLGDLRASRALIRAMSNMKNFYRRGAYKPIAGQTQTFEFQAIDEGIRAGVITEAMASELAGLAQGGNLFWGTGGNSLQRMAAHFYEKSAWMFEMAEQWNRRISYRAALDLAMQYNNAKYVNEAVAANQVKYRELTQSRGFTPQQARAIVTAMHATEQTQFVYARYGRPRFMRGRVLGTVFIFKRYLQGLTFLGINNPGFLWRYLFIMMLMGGMGGLPGYEDLKGILNGVMRRLGFNFDLEKEVRKYILDHVNENIPPDMVIHGMARRGYGIPAALDMMGSLWTGRPGRGLAPGPNQNVPAPVFDRSKAITAGPYLPFDAGKLIDPSMDRNKAIADQSQKAAGAAFGIAFNLYKFLMDDKLSMSDQKRWERAMPRELGALSKMFRTYTEGRERTMGGPHGGSTFLNYDVRDTEQLMEVIGMGLGYNNVRNAGKWDQVMAQSDHESYIKFERNGLFEQFNEARRGGDSRELDSVRDAIRKFNEKIQGTEDRGMAITAESLQRSVTSRERAIQAREIGVPTQKGKIPIAREYQRLFPESTVDVRKVQ